MIDIYAGWGLNSKYIAMTFHECIDEARLYEVKRYVLHWLIDVFAAFSVIRNLICRTIIHPLHNKPLDHSALHFGRLAIQPMTGIHTYLLVV